MSECPAAEILFRSLVSTSGAAVVDVYDGPTRRTVTLGPWESEQAHQEYERLLTRLRIGKPAVETPGAGPADMTVALVRYTAHIEVYHRTPDGTPTGTADDIKITLGYFARLFAPRVRHPLFQDSAAGAHR